MHRCNKLCHTSIVPQPNPHPQTALQFILMCQIYGSRFWETDRESPSVGSIQHRLEAEHCDQMWLRCYIGIVCLDEANDLELCSWI